MEILLVEDNLEDANGTIQVLHDGHGTTFGEMTLTETKAKNANQGKNFSCRNVFCW